MPCQWLFLAIPKQWQNGDSCPGPPFCHQLTCCCEESQRSFLTGERLFNLMPLNLQNMTGVSVEVFKAALDTRHEKSCELYEPSSRKFLWKVWTFLVNKLNKFILCIKFEWNHSHLGIYIKINDFMGRNKSFVVIYRYQILLNHFFMPKYVWIF